MYIICIYFLHSNLGYSKEYPGIPLAPPVDLPLTFSWIIKGKTFHPILKAEFMLTLIPYAYCPTIYSIYPKVKYMILLGVVFKIKL